MGAVGSTALDANGDVRPEWLGRVGLFFMDLRQAEILRVALHPALGNHQDQASFVSLPCSGSDWKWRRRSPIKIMERTHEEATEALHAGREGRHPEAASVGAGADLRAV
jgi:hypothetical protein